MTGAPKPLESLTLDKLIGRFREIEDENARLLALVEKMLPVIEAAGMVVTFENIGAPNPLAVTLLRTKLRELAEPSGNSGELEPG